MDFGGVIELDLPRTRRAWVINFKDQIDRGGQENGNCTQLHVSKACFNQPVAGGGRGKLESHLCLYKLIYVHMYPSTDL